MTDLPWLVPTTDGERLARNRAERTGRAALDLAAVADVVDGYLVLHEAVDLAFALAERHLPPGTIDLRQGDPLALAIANPRAVVVSAGGIFIGTPIETDPRWAALEELGQPTVLLGSSALSGAYLGCHLRGPEAMRLIDGMRRQDAT